ncbi:acyl-CoA dehydrogenase family protein [Mycolicibacterium sp. BiH015]|uniref:acyl-CoA dehydrogenase family protein n=1 Tax=Mycolicibacterium sp. BiH015 TaxID=3018808 RepID=UPI0022E83AA5|nr:acyl-CoA dehydrogenase family protein [Mycolicibacterium sp. BiH015]MDA2890192.1 acyl-CoA dehydrogenase family protein [Mycolicibacterium sp. BiH015]
MTVAVSRAEAAAAVRDKLRETAAQRDQLGADPLDEIDWLRETGLLGIFIPDEYGGGGATWSQVAQVVQTIAEADSSIAHVLLYHYFGSLAGTRGENGFVGTHRARRIAENRLFHGTVAQAAYPPLILATQTSDGFRLNGSKPFTSGAALADVLLVWTVFDEGTTLLGDDVSGQLATFHVERTAPGVSFGGDWDNVGQRLTVSGTTTLADVAVGTADVIGYGYGVTEATAADHLDVLHMYAGFASIFTGIAVGALTEAADYTRGRSRAWVESGRERATDDPLILERYGRLWTQVQSAIALSDRANVTLDAVRAEGSGLSWEQRAEAVTLINAARVHASDVALSVSSGLFELTGARSTAAADGLDRFWRNVRTLSLHDPLPHKQVQIGDFFLNRTEPPPGFYS